MPAFRSVVSMSPSHLIAVGPDLNLAWHFRCRVALPVIRPTARADQRDAS